MPHCINLLTRFGDRYKIRFDAAYDPKHRRQENLDPWYMMIPCNYGTIYPHGGDDLRIDIDYHNRIANRAAALPGCTLVQYGDYERTVQFHVDGFDAIAAIVHPYRKRSITKHEREKLIAAGRKTRFSTRRKIRVPRRETAV